MRFGVYLLKKCGLLVLWFLCFLVCIRAILWWNTEYYQIDVVDVNNLPNPRFQVVIEQIEQEDGVRVVPFAQAQSLQPHQKWSQTPSDADCVESCLRLKNGRDWVFYDEGALWSSESTYRIENNRLIPISFLFYSFVDAFLAFFGAFGLLGVVKYIWQRWRLRDNPTELRLYHQMVKIEIRNALIALLVLGICVAISSIS